MMEDVRAKEKYITEFFLMVTQVVSSVLCARTCIAPTQAHTVYVCACPYLLTGRTHCEHARAARDAAAALVGARERADERIGDGADRGVHARERERVRVCDALIQVDEGLKDNFDTPRAMAGLLALIAAGECVCECVIFESLCAVYLYSSKAGAQRRPLLITKVGDRAV
jgi:hypothetical protein